MSGHNKKRWQCNGNQILWGKYRVYPYNSSGIVLAVYLIFGYFLIVRETIDKLTSDKEYFESYMYYIKGWDEAEYNHKSIHDINKALHCDAMASQLCRHILSLT